MSHILDALKKLEQEKSRKNRPGGMVNISGALFEQQRPKPPAKSVWKVILAVAAAVLITFAASWYIFKPGGSGQNGARPQAAPSSAIVQATDTAPALPVQPAAPVPPASLPAVPPVPAVPRASAPAAPAKPSAEKSAPVAEEAAARPAMQEQGNKVRERQGQLPVADQMIPPPADIKLSGIAWQDERGSRRAVVNGFLMQEGGVVSGAKITDIFPDRVRFSQSGKFFEIPLVSGAVPPAAK